MSDKSLWSTIEVNDHFYLSLVPYRRDALKAGHYYVIVRDGSKLIAGYCLMSANTQYEAINLAHYLQDYITKLYGDVHQDVVFVNQLSIENWSEPGIIDTIEFKITQHQQPIYN